MNRNSRMLALAAAAGAAVCAHAYPTFDGGDTSVHSSFVLSSGSAAPSTGPLTPSGGLLSMGTGPSQGFHLSPTSAPPSDPVPEPFTMALGAGALALAAARKRRKTKV